MISSLLASLLADRLIARGRRNPHESLADYMDRSWLIRQNADKSNICIRIHHVKRSDEDRALHCHPWWNVSWLLRGGYWEVVPGIYQAAREAGFEGATAQLLAFHERIVNEPGEHVSRSDRRELKKLGVHWRGRGAIVLRSSRALHRLVVPAGRDAWSLFMMGGKSKEWGFQTRDRGWVHNVEYTKELGRDV